MSKINLERIGRELKERRGERGLREVAAESGISTATLSRIEAGKQPDLETFSKLCKWLQLDASEVLGCGTATESASSSDSQGVSVHFRAHREINPKTATHLSELILAVHRLLEDEDDVKAYEWEDTAA